MRDNKKSTHEGFLSVFKPHGWTSHDVVGLVRRLAGTRRVGHGGTLDPAATGVLVVAVGRATRLVDYMANQDKSYRADIVFGSTTTTDDAEGRVLRSHDPTGLGLDAVVSALPGFLGQIDQVPPQYSAVKLRGRKAYEIARAGGAAVLNARRVTIRGLAVVGWNPPILTVQVLCSKGTYIRSLARDLGERLGVGAHLGSLVRLAAGPFRIQNAASVDELRAAAGNGRLGDLMQPPDLAVCHLPALVVPDAVAAGMVLGRAWRNVGVATEGDTARVYSERGEFLGLAVAVGERWQPKVVL